MARTLSIGDPPIEVTIRRKAASRRVVLSLGRSGREPVVTAPASASEAHLLAFAQEHEGWLRGQMSLAPASLVVREGTRLPFRGVEVTVACRPGPAGIQGDRLFVPSTARQVPVRVAAFLKETAREVCLQRAEAFAAMLGRRVTRLSIRDTRGRWGSCNDAGKLMFSWRLILAPPAVLDYVAAHEVAHLVEMNHSDRFWRLVRNLYGDVRVPRDWLKRNGQTLMRYDFDAIIDD